MSKEFITVFVHCSFPLFSTCTEVCVHTLFTYAYTTHTNMTSSKSIWQISQQVFALPSAKGQVVHTCKINCYGAVQLGSSFQVVHERVNLPHLKWNQVDQTRVCVWRLLLLQTQTLSCIQQRAEPSAAWKETQDFKYVAVFVFLANNSKCCLFNLHGLCLPWQWWRNSFLRKENLWGGLHYLSQ
jgi:hypothetical protein